METKVCTRCKVEKEFTEFRKRSDTGGHISKCIGCQKEYRAEYYSENRNKASANSREYYLNNKEYIAKWRKDAYNNNKEKSARHSKNYYINNKKKIQQYKKKYNVINRVRIAKVRRRYKKKYHKYKQNTSALYRFKCSVRSSVATPIRNNGYKKSSRTQEILGCDFETLLMHLEKSFVENYGILPSEYPEVEIHIDHITPVSSAQTEEEVLALNHFTNLQWLFATDNLQKSNKLDFKIR